MLGRSSSRQDVSQMGSHRKTLSFFLISCLSWQQQAASHSDPLFGGRYKTFFFFLEAKRQDPARLDKPLPKNPEPALENP